MLVLVLAIGSGQASAEEKNNSCGGLSLPLETPENAQEQRDLLLRQATECMQQAKRAQAMALITEVIKSNPTDAEAYMNRGSVQTSLGEVELAISDFTTAIRLDPNLAPAWYNIGTTLAHVGRYESAIADFTEAMRLQPDFPVTAVWRRPSLAATTKRLPITQRQLSRIRSRLIATLVGVLSILRWANTRKRSTTSPDSSNSEPTL
jgi:Tfp pilus assembly protein PilF